MSDVERAARRWVVAFRAKHEAEKRWQSREIEFDSFFEALREFHETRRALFEAVDARPGLTRSEEDDPLYGGDDTDAI